MSFLPRASRGYGQSTNEFENKTRVTVECFPHFISL